MPTLLTELIFDSAARTPDAAALTDRTSTLTYAALAELVRRLASGLLAAGLEKNDRVAFYLPKRIESVATMFGTACAGGIFVPVNPLLKSEQVTHILRDCAARVLITTKDRYESLREIHECEALRTVVLLDGGSAAAPQAGRQVCSWDELLAAGRERAFPRVIDADVAAILYTSGSTGKPKGVVLSQRNMVAGAVSVAQYLENDSSDRILAVLPLSFDYGFSQVSTSFLVGAQVVLFEYLLPRDVLNAIGKHAITGLAGVPPLWIQLAGLEWPESATGLRYITNSGGAMPRPTLEALRKRLPRTKVFLMYGLTEAFRSTYLPPSELDRRPGSIGKAIPNAEILVVRRDGTPCAPNEPGELVHRGALVGLGYWNDPARTAERYRPVPGQLPGTVLPELAVWSGDTVMRDEEGFLYFVGRHDEMIKTSGYRVSPTEVEEQLLATGLVTEVAAFGVPHPVLGQAIAVAAAAEAGRHDTDALLAICRQRMPNFMVPAHITWRDALPRSPNGKIDRKQLGDELKRLFADPAP